MLHNNVSVYYTPCLNKVPAFSSLITSTLLNRISRFLADTHYHIASPGGTGSCSPQESKSTEHQKSNRVKKRELNDIYGQYTRFLGSYSVVRPSLPWKTLWQFW